MKSRKIIIEARSGSEQYHREFIPNDIMKLRPTNTWVVTILKLVFDELPDDMTEMVIRIENL
jgi:hypothetical protein